MPTKPLPWEMIRRALAKEWHCRPSEIDLDDDADEIGVTLELWTLEQDYGPKD